MSKLESLIEIYSVDSIISVIDEDYMQKEEEFLNEVYITESNLENNLQLTRRIFHNTFIGVKDALIDLRKFHDKVSKMYDKAEVLYKDEKYSKVCGMMRTSCKILINFLENIVSVGLGVAGLVIAKRANPGDIKKIIMPIISLFGAFLPLAANISSMRDVNIDVEEKYASKFIDVLKEYIKKCDSAEKVLEAKIAREEKNNNNK